MARSERLFTISRLAAYWTPPVAYAAMIFYLSSLSHPEEYLPSLFSTLSDKLLHALEYGALGVLSYRAFRFAASPWAARHALVLAIAASVLYGLSDELHQAFVPFREADVWDLLADTAGASVAVWGWRWLIDAHGAGRTSLG